MSPLKTYLVEDSPVIRDSLIAALEELVPVTVVGSAEDESTALRWLADPAHDADLVIVDLFLKSGSGLGVLAALAPGPSQRPRAKVVVLSNYATPAMRQKCLALGADQVFDKSRDIEALVDWCGRLAQGDGRAGA
jgi:DNA-binding NarL/FixJ family response regulator